MNTRIRVLWSALLVLAPVAVLLRFAHWPLTGDQALFMYGAEQLARGAALYRDFWDLKAPGVYLFYWAAGSVSGFSAFGLHLLEALWLGTAAWLIYAACRPSMQGLALVHWVPLAAVGGYFLAASSWHLTQPDGLLVLPLALACWALVADRDLGVSPRAAWFVVGLASALAMLIVTASVLVALALIATRWAFGRFRAERTKPRDGLLNGLALGMGFLAPLAAMFAWFASQGALSQALWTMFIYPVEAQLAFDRDPARYIASIRWFVRESAVLIPAAAVGFFVTVAQARQRCAQALPGLLVIAWLVAGLVVPLLQYHYSWQFHLIHLFVPVGVLAAIGAAEAWRQLRSGGAAAVCAGVLALTAAFPLLLLNKATGRGESVPAVDPFRQSALVGLADAAPADTAYVIGDPRILRAAGRTPVIAENGWALEILLERQWANFAATMRSRGPTYLYIGKSYDAVLMRGSPELLGWIEREYVEVARDTLGGRWLRRKAPG